MSGLEFYLSHLATKEHQSAQGPKSKLASQYLLKCQKAKAICLLRETLKQVESSCMHSTKITKNHEKSHKIKRISNFHRIFNGIFVPKSNYKWESFFTPRFCKFWHFSNFLVGAS